MVTGIVSSTRIEIACVWTLTCTAFRQRIYRGLVCVRIAFALLRVLLERDIESVICLHASKIALIAELGSSPLICSFADVDELLGTYRHSRRPFYLFPVSGFPPRSRSDTYPNLPTFPRRRRSNSVNPTTPTFLSDVEAPPPTKPVVYSPVPI
jgi:hypothetical protein